MSLFAVLLAIHIALAITLFLPSFLLPFVLRARGPAPDARPLGRTLLRLQASGSVLVALSLAVTGAGLVAILGPSLLGQPWLLLALAVYAVNLALAFFVQRPSLRRLIGLRSSTGYEERERWARRARRQRYVSYLMAAAVGLIGYLMSMKPQLW